ncbi:MAG: adenylate kinase [Clostridia bacterium]|nr:adenylate kinase [Clostridia bacterium]
MQKVIIIGSPGAGKSTFARKLRDKTGLPLYYLDKIWHKPDKTTVSKEEFDARLSAILATECWIIDGNYGRTLEMRMQACDTVFLFDLPAYVCLEGLRERLGQEHEDLPWTETELDAEFMQWVADFPNKQLLKIYRLFEQYKSERNMFIFHTREEADAFILNLSKYE